MKVLKVETVTRGSDPNIPIEVGFNKIMNNSGDNKHITVKSNNYLFRNVPTSGSTLPLWTRGTTLNKTNKQYTVIPLINRNTFFTQTLTR